MHGVSVIICCFNSSKKLVKTLDYLSRQLTTSPWEIILVDNASTDSTNAIAAKIWSDKGCHVKIKILSEPEKGQAAARRKGIRESMYDVLLFCDDDNWLDSHYVDSVLYTMSLNKHVGVLGGCGEAVADVLFPDWFQQAEQSYAVGIQASNSHGNVPRNWVYGAGMAVRKSALTKLDETGSKYLLAGRTSGLIFSGDDTEMCYLIKLCGYEIWHDTSLTFKHSIAENRLSLIYIQKLYRSFGRAKYILNCYEFAISGRLNKSPLWLKDILYSIYYLIVRLLKTKRFCKVDFYFELQYIIGFIEMLLKNRSKYDLQAKRIFDFWQERKLFITDNTQEKNRL